MPAPPPHAAPAADRVGAQVQEAIDGFVSRRVGRSVAVRRLGPASAGWSGDGDVVRPGASVLKVPLVMSVLRQGVRDGIDLSAEVEVGQLPGSRFPALIDVLDRSRRLSVRELCGLSLATSDNALAEHLRALVGNARVEELLRSLRCRSTRLEVGFGDEHLGPEGRRNVTTADDMVRLVAEVVSSPDMEVAAMAMGRSVQGDRIPLRLRPQLRTGHKTGTLAGVCNDVGFLSDGCTTLVLAFLCDDEVDVARTSLEIAECSRALWESAGSRP